MKYLTRCRLLTGLLVLAGLAACANSGERYPEPRCRAAGAQAQLGETLDDRVTDEARWASGAMRTRVIRPGQAVTMDADPQRLNIEVDETGRVRRLRCG
jgi:hypothetical protein